MRGSKARLGRVCHPELGNDDPLGNPSLIPSPFVLVATERSEGLGL